MWICNTCNKRMMSLEEGRNAHWEANSWWHLGCCVTIWHEQEHEWRLADRSAKGRIVPETSTEQGQ